MYTILNKWLLEGIAQTNAYFYNKVLLILPKNSLINHGLYKKKYKKRGILSAKV